MRPELSRVEREILELIVASQQTRGFPPSVREVGAHIGVKSTSTVAHHLRRLEWKGYLHREEGIARGLTVVKEAA